MATSLSLSLAARWAVHPAMALAPHGHFIHDLESRLADLGGPDPALALTGVGLALVLVKSAAGVYATYVQVRIGGRIGCALRLEVLDALLALHPLRQPRQSDQGSGGNSPSRAVLALTERVRDIELGLSSGALAALRAIAQLLPLGGLLIALSPGLAGAAGVLLGVFGWALGRVRGLYRQALRREAAENARLHEAADECVRHAELWATYGAQQTARASVRKLGEAVARGGAALGARAAALSGANEVLAAFVLFAVLAASRSGWRGASSEGTSLLSFAVPFFLAYRPLRELADARLSFSRAECAYEELRDRIHRPPQDASRKAAPSLSGCSQDALPRAVPVPRPKAGFGPGVLELIQLGVGRGVERVSLRLEPGEIAVVVGPTGTGKSTLLRTLLGLEAATNGAIAFAGVPITAAGVGPDARPFAWVPQDAPILADTLAANVRLGAGSEAAPEAHLEALGARHLASTLGDARLGPGGRPISGGERQWIALARALATRQPVLLLDEPTSGLDEVAQRLVLQAITQLRGKRTVILVTHRTEPLAIADVVVRLGTNALAMGSL